PGLGDRDRPGRVALVDLHDLAAGPYLDHRPGALRVQARVEQDLVQVGAVVMPVRGVVLALAEVPEAGQPDHAAVLPAAPYLVEGFGADGPAPSAQSETQQNAAGVRRGLDAGAHLAELGGLLEDGDAEPALAQGQRGRQSSEAASHDRDVV